jgi:hypothetical protein
MCQQSSYLPSSCSSCFFVSFQGFFQDLDQHLVGSDNCRGRSLTLVLAGGEES